MTQPPNPLDVAFAAHGRGWRDFLYVYPVISRRAHGLSIGVNLNPDKRCNFGCVYCQVDRTRPAAATTLDLQRLERELNALTRDHQGLFGETEFRDIPPAWQRLNDFAFSGDGEPTGAPEFPQAARLVAQARQRVLAAPSSGRPEGGANRAAGADLAAPYTAVGPPKSAIGEVKIITITNGCYLHLPTVAEALAFLDEHNGEIWAKLDAGTPEYFARINGPSHALEHVLGNIVSAARVRPIVIQSMFLRLDGEAMSQAELDAYLRRLRQIVAECGVIKLVQIYTVARPPAQPGVTRLSVAELNSIADRVRALGLAAEVFA